MGTVIKNCFVHAASLASILGLYLTLRDKASTSEWWHPILVFFVLLITVLALAHEVWAYIKNKPKVYKTTKKINKYMHDWISAGGRVVIFSRDMSWAAEGDIQKLLASKAEKKELTICLENEIPLTNELKLKGATIVTYKHYGHVPRSRFTIVDYERDGARVAVGVKMGGDHVIQEYRSGTHPFFAVAEDLIKFLTANLKQTDVQN